MNIAPRFARSPFGCGFLSLALLACGESEADTGEAASTTALPTSAALWSQTDGYENWSAVPGREGVFASDSGSTPYVAEWLSPETAAAMAEDGAVAGRMPEGALIVRACYADAAGTDLTGVTVMLRRAGADPDHADWIWAKFDPVGAEVVPPSDGAAACSSCHAARAADNDWILSFEH